MALRIQKLSPTELGHAVCVRAGDGISIFKTNLRPASPSLHDVAMLSSHVSATFFAALFSKHCPGE